MQRLFLGVIDAANRANVSIYTMDAAGLRAESEQAKIRDQVNAGRRSGGISLGHSSEAEATPAVERRWRRTRTCCARIRTTGLGKLAQDTGGLLFENTNNLRQGFDRDRERPPQLLPRRVHADQRQLRRPLPQRSR